MDKYRCGFQLLANARAFLESAVGFVERGYPEEKRFAILHLVTGLELLLKARVAMVNPRLLIPPGMSVSDEAFDRGSFRSIGMQEAIEVLTKAGYLVLPDRQMTQLSILRKMRNRVTHFIDAADEIEARSALGAGVQLFIDLHNADFRDDDLYRAKGMHEIARELSRCKEFVSARFEQLSARLKSSSRPQTRYFVECGNCLQDATVIEGESLKCLFCDFVDTIQSWAELISDNSSVERCPTCGRLSVARHKWKDNEPTYECICCGFFRGPELFESRHSPSDCRRQSFEAIRPQFDCMERRGSMP